MILSYYPKDLPEERKKIYIDLQFTGSRAKEQQGSTSTVRKEEETTDVTFEEKNPPRTLASPEAVQTEMELITVIYSSLPFLVLFYCTIIYIQQPFSL